MNISHKLKNISILKREYARSITLLTGALIAGFFAVGQISSKNSTGDVTDITQVQKLDTNSLYYKIWQPYIAILDSQTYIATYGLQLTGKTDMGDILCSVSKDRGKTWGHPITIFSSQEGKYGYANSVLYKSPEQDIIWCYAMRCVKYYKNTEESELVAAYSGDGGVTWIPVELQVDFQSPLITNASILSIKDERGTKYLLAVHRNTKHYDPYGDRRQFVLESRDLLRWKLAGYIPMPEGKEIFLCEGNMALEENNKDIKIVMRTADYKDPAHVQVNPPRAYSSISKDDGKTWSPAKEEPTLYNTNSKGFFGRDSKGHYVYVYNDGLVGQRTSLRYVVKSSGKDWSGPRLFYWDANRNSYATLIEEKPGVFICVWDSSDDIKRARTVIRFGRLDLNQ
ncbi:MAG TPA: sialidase family protein [Puia sp.]|nr:sialidase family protein [Puia sp.]